MALQRQEQLKQPLQRVAALAQGLQEQNAAAWAPMLLLKKYC
jgi:hypothetical protein